MAASSRSSTAKRKKSPLVESSRLFITALVAPAKPGSMTLGPWIPAFAGMTVWSGRFLVYGISLSGLASFQALIFFFTSSVVKSFAPSMKDESRKVAGSISALISPTFT
jgi:hypothetical protein